MRANIVMADEAARDASAPVENCAVPHAVSTPWWQAMEVWLLGAVLVAGVLFASPDGETVRLRVWPNVSLPEVCAARRCFGWQCPLCGATRSSLALLQGQWSESLKLHRLGWWCLGIIVATALVAVGCRSFQWGSPTFSARFTYWCWAVTVALLIANRTVELCGW